jgi:hypothetical protein
MAAAAASLIAPASRAASTAESQQVIAESFL